MRIAVAEFKEHNHYTIAIEDNVAWPDYLHSEAVRLALFGECAVSFFKPDCYGQPIHDRTVIVYAL